MNVTPYGGLDVDDRRTITATFKDADGLPATIDTADLTIVVEPPNGDSYEVTVGDITVDDGVVTFKIHFDQGGTWKWRVTWTTLSGSESSEGSVRVRSRRTFDPEP